jgi:hypothetical protein
MYIIGSQRHLKLTFYDFSLSSFVNFVPVVVQLILERKKNQNFRSLKVQFNSCHKFA